MKNQVIKNLNPDIGKKIIEYWKKLYPNSNFKYYRGVISELGGNIAIYYGFIDYRFGAYTLYDVNKHNAEIITLPKENFYPKVMMVSISPIDQFNSGKKRVVFMEKCGKFLAWHAVQTIEDAEKITTVSSWEYASDIEENKETTETRLEEISTLISDLGDKVRIMKLQKYD